ncbi:MAG: hypothetical protein JXX29_09500 [Deltaproteobacteria bacterium]|nr:hypothetical protein [Deltaproteobacteria bacterium]MBN2671899.1 hypothetical protein [Deltaproteobacteria bacterium]
MTRREIESELRKSALPEIELSKNNDAVRNALKYTVARTGAHVRKKRIVRTIFSMGVTVGFALGIAMVWLLQSEPPQVVTPPPQVVATNLGTMWGTYSDNQSGGNSVVWPPESSDGQNNFVKSSPGYGEKGYAVRFKGKAGEQRRPGFIGVSAVLGPPGEVYKSGGVNIRRYEKIRFKMKGQMSGGELVLRISNVEPDNESAATVFRKPDIAYEAQITDKMSEDWQTVTLDLRTDFSFASPNSAKVKVEDLLADARHLKWHVRDAAGATVDVWIDELEFY